MSAIKGVPHPFPYQGSKRQLASEIVACIPRDACRLIEPFVGSGAITLAAGYLRRADRFVLNDIHAPLIALWKEIINRPVELANNYESLWQAQQGKERAFYDEVRDAFNKSQEPHLFLYLLARCVKAAVRYNANGEFNNSPDNRRLGMRPETMRRNIVRTSELLRGRSRVFCKDYRDILHDAAADDVVYVDPPYQGVCNTRDHRYCGGVTFDQFVGDLKELNQRGVPYLVSYDGRTGSRIHGQPLPEELELKQFDIHVGRSTQATLLGRSEDTVESLYLSPTLLERIGKIPIPLSRKPQPTLFDSL